MEGIINVALNLKDLDSFYASSLRTLPYSTCVLLVICLTYY